MGLYLTCESCRLGLADRLSLTAINILTDAFTWLLPLKVVLKLQVNKRTRILLIIILSLGLLYVPSRGY